MMERSRKVVVGAFVFTVAILTVGYIAFGLVTDLIFASGFLTGFVIWLFSKQQPDSSELKVPYWLTLVIFIGHRVEEKVAGFFNALADITGVPTPEILSVPVIALVLVSVGAWLLIPLLIKRKLTFGYYLLWTFFSAMGITELAHFVLPFFTGQPYGYFPGMISVIFLAPVAWWGIYRLSKKPFYYDTIDQP